MEEQLAKTTLDNFVFFLKAKGADLHEDEWLIIIKSLVKVHAKSIPHELITVVDADPNFGLPLSQLLQKNIVKQQKQNLLSNTNQIVSQCVI